MAALGSFGQIEGFSANIYDQVRLFSYALDKAIARLPWGPIAQFTLNVAELSKGDLRLGSKQSFREFVGTHQMSPFTIATPEFVGDIFNAASAEVNADLRASIPNMRASIKQVCEKFMLSRREQP